MSETKRYAHEHAPEPTRRGQPVSDHVRYHVIRAIGMAKGWLDRDRWVEAGGRPRTDFLLLTLAEAQVARLWVGVRDREDPQALADWQDRFEDPDVWLEWMSDEATRLGVDWDDIKAYGGDNRPTQATPAGGKP